MKEEEGREMRALGVSVCFNSEEESERARREERASIEGGAEYKQQMGFFRFGGGLLESLG